MWDTVLAHARVLRNGDATVLSQHTPVAISMSWLGAEDWDPVTNRGYTPPQPSPNW